MISEGQRNDIICAIPVLKQVKDMEGSQVLADRGYDSLDLIDYIYDRGGEPTIPSRKGAKYEFFKRALRIWVLGHAGAVILMSLACRI